MKNGASPVRGDAPHSGMLFVPKPAATWRDGERQRPVAIE
jgi:hypothetical protein